MSGRRALAALAAAAALAVAPAALALAPPAEAAQALRAGSSPAPGGLSPFRVDVSRYPEVGLVVTVPAAAGAAARPLGAGDFSVTAGGRQVAPQVRRLSDADLEVTVAPAGGVPAAALAAERSAAQTFLAGLPVGARTAAVLPGTAAAGAASAPLSGDPAPAILDAGHAGTAQQAGRQSAGTASDEARLDAALSEFTAGASVRRTVVLAVTAAQPVSRAAQALFAQRLAASGTELFVLDAAPGSAPVWDALAAGSGGFAARVAGSANASGAGWQAACARVSAALAGQYYLRFADPGPLPGRAALTVKAGSGTFRGTADLPVRNPVAPPLPPAPARPAAAPGSAWDLPLVLLATALIAFGVTYGLAMLAASRRDPVRRARHARGAAAAGAGDGGGRPRAAADGLFFVFLMPCLNEEAVIAESLRRLLALPCPDFAVMVIDDGSDDRTAEMVAGVGDDRVLLLQRALPQARQGKGEALNAAVRHLVNGGYLAGRDPDRVIAVVVDADGRLDPEAPAAVAPAFADPVVGAVQIGVRINNRFRSVLARMQDMEFVIYTEVFQRGRRHIGSVGLGGNGQFMRLTALLSLGPSPWSRSLAEDLDMGIRLIAAGWRNEYCGAVAVHQQGVEQLPRLIRQRSRWFQGHLQSWRSVPLVLRRVRGTARADLLYHMTSPAVLLIASLLSASFVLSIANAALEAARGQDPAGWWLASTYTLTFGPALAFSAVYWAKERANGLRPAQAAVLAHLYVCYGMMWYAAGWWGVSRTLRGRTSWAKTDRVAEELPPGAESAPRPAPARAPAAALAPAVHVLAASGAREAAGAAPPRPVPAPPRAVPVPASEPAPPAAGAPPAGGAGRGPGRGGRRRPRRRAVLAAAAVLAAGAAAAVPALAARGPGPASAWMTAFNGYGTTSVAGSGAAASVSVSPERATAPSVSHAALMVSARTYGDFAATVRLRTVAQLRTGSAGKPNPWEVGWVIWHYTSDQHFYALTLEAGGWELSKQDPSYPGSERFLASGKDPRFPPGHAYAVGVVQVGDQITVSAGGRVLVRYTDSSHPYLSGSAGLYAEDASAVFDHIQISQLPAEGH